MRVAFVGGIERMDRSLGELASELGVELEIHDGDVGGRRAEGLVAAVRRADHVVVFSGIASHGGVNHAKRAARQYGRGLTICRSYGLAVARKALEGIVSERGAHESIRRLAS